MVENSIVAEKEKESNLFKKEARKTLTDFTEKLGVYLKLFEDPNVKDGKYKAMKKIDELENGDKELGLNQYAPLYKLARQYLNGEIEDRIKYNDKVNSFIKKETKKIDLVANAIIEAGIKNIAKEETLKEIQEKYKNIPQKELKQMIDELIENEDVVEEGESERNNATMEVKEETENSAEINEVEQDEFDPEKDLPRPKIDGDIKKIYNYKVEGKITSGISELDQFLEIIQPALNQLIIIPWKFVYTAFDAKKMAFEKIKNYYEKQNIVGNMHEALKLMSFDDENGNTIKAIPDGDEFVRGWNLKKNQGQIAGYFNHYMCAKLDKKLKENKEARINKIMNKKNIGHSEAEQIFKKEEIGDFIDNGFSPSDAEEEYRKKYEPRKKFFDFSKEADTAQNVLVEEFQNLIRKVRGPDGKVSDENMKKLSGFIAMIDLFNLNDKDMIPNNYGYTLSYMLSEIQSRSKPGKPRIEDDKSIITDAKSKQESDDIATQFKNYVQSMQASNSNG